MEKEVTMKRFKLASVGSILLTAIVLFSSFAGSVVVAQDSNNKTNGIGEYKEILDQTTFSHA